MGEDRKNEDEETRKARNEYRKNLKKRYAKKYKRGEYPPDLPRGFGGKIVFFQKRSNSGKELCKVISDSKGKGKGKGKPEINVPNEYWVMAITWIEENKHIVNSIYKRYLRCGGVLRLDWVEEIDNFVCRELAVALIRYDPFFGMTLDAFSIQAIHLCIKRWRGQRLRDLTAQVSLTELTKSYEADKEILKPYTVMKDVDNEKVIPPLMQAVRIFLKDKLHPADYKIYELSFIQEYEDKVIAAYIGQDRSSVNKKRGDIGRLIIANRQNIEKIELAIINGDIVVE